MPDNSQYILSFNLDEVSSQITGVGRSYTELGDTIRGISRSVQDDVESTNQKLSAITSTLSVLTSSLDLTFATLGKHLVETSHLVEDIAKHSKTISENFSNLPSTLTTPGISQAKDTVGERTADVLGGAAVGGILAGGGKDGDTEAVGAVKSEIDSMVEDAQKRLTLLAKSLEDTKKQSGGIADILKKEAKSAKSGAMSLVSGASMGAVGGGLLAGALSMMILGYKEGDRKQAEKGEMLNVLEATGESLFSKPVQKANNWFGKFQENAQFFYGIGRKEIQAVVKQMVDSGHDAIDLTKEFNSELGEVGINTVTLAIGLDKHLNLASGDSMKKITSLVQDYGTSMGDAATNVMNLSLKAQQSGAGISKFMDSVMSGSSALAQYGIDLKEIVNLTSTLEDHYTAMGLDKQYAGQLATSAASGIAQGMAGLQTPMQMMIASEMGLGTGYEGLQKLEEGWSRVKEGGQKEHFVERLNAMRAIQEREVGGASRAVKIAFWKEQNMTGPAATAFVDQASKGDFKRLLVSTEASAEALDGLKKAFKTEGEQVSEIQKDQRDIINGMASVGKGILQMVSGLLGVIIVGIRSIPALIDYAVNKLMPGGDGERADRIMDAILATQKKQFAVLGAGMESTAEGTDKLADTVFSKMNKVFGSGLKSAIGDDFSGYQAIDKMAKKELLSFIDDNARSINDLRAHVDEFIYGKLDELLGGDTYFGRQAAKETKSIAIGEAQTQKAEARLRDEFGAEKNPEYIQAQTTETNVDVVIPSGVLRHWSLAGDDLWVPGPGAVR